MGMLVKHTLLYNYASLHFPTTINKIHVHLYRAAMMEFEINMSEMPLGKLSKRHIERGSPATVLSSFCFQCVLSVSTQQIRNVRFFSHTLCIWHFHVHKDTCVT